jgi:hypothetical protein
MPPTCGVAPNRVYADGRIARRDAKPSSIACENG